MADESADRVSRRELLKAMTGSAGVAVGLRMLVSCPLGATTLAKVPADPAKISSYAPKYFSSRQIQEIAAISDAIIPADEHSPGANAARVYEFIDEMVAIGDEDEKRLWQEGLSTLNRLARNRWDKDLAECPREQQEALLREISRNEEHPEKVEEQFFVAIKRLTVDGYYRSDIGIHQDLNYQGNTMLLEFDGCDHGSHKAEDQH
ncbi:MAG TPA: gluconate 2-dehydrogenase subunit 3 family protein [Terriglobia bacterium]|nr:gluconate 2-dehydrogenase subunit 3 family protein [Terriglobia bacterium]